MRALASSKKVTDNFVFTFFPRRIVYLPKFCKPHYTTSVGHLQLSKGRISFSPGGGATLGIDVARVTRVVLGNFLSFALFFLLSLFFLHVLIEMGAMKSSAV